MSEHDKYCVRALQAYIDEDLAPKLATAESNLARAVEALEEIAKFDAPAEGGEYTKMWMRLGRKASEALATIRGETK